MPGEAKAEDCCLAALELVAWPSSRRTSAVVVCAFRPQAPSCRCGRRPQPGDEHQDFLEHLPRHRDLSQLEDDVAAVAHHLGADLDQHPGKLCPRVGFIVTNLARPAERIVAFYNHRGTCEQYIKEGKGAIKWTRLSCRSFAANAVRLQLHALAYNLGNFMRTLAMPKTAEPWSLTSLREKLIKIGAKVVSHGRYVTFQMAEVAVPRQMFQEILSLIARLRAPPAPA